MKLCGVLYMAGFISLWGATMVFSQPNIWQATGGPAGQVIKALAINSNNHIFAGGAGANGQIFRSTDNGDNWVQVTSWSNTYVWSFAINQNGEIFAGTNGGEGVYRSSDGGNSWSAFNSGLTSLEVRSLALDHGGYVFAGAGSEGVFRTVEPTTSLQVVANEIPGYFYLGQNYPNPFNPRTTIRFSLAKKAFVSIKVYDPGGKEIAALVNAIKEIGTHEIVFDARNLPGGVYFYRMQAGNYSAARKLILIK